MHGIMPAFMSPRRKGGGVEDELGGDKCCNSPFGGYMEWGEALPHLWSHPH